MATLYIDNKSYEVKPGKNLLETCLSLGIDLPYFCWHPALGSVGACRQCAIKVYKDENDQKGRLIMSCMEPVTNNQRISIKDHEAVEFREHVIEWLMTNHPHDCAVCDEGGSCHLQDMTVMTGHAYRRFQFKKRTHRNQYLGPFINHEMNRCIQCYRCVRYYKDYAGGKDLDAFASRSNVYFGRHQDGVLENEFSGNLTEICPTGVFTDKTLKEHYTRKWDLTTAPSICNHCSLGCNTIAGERYGSLRLITTRYHGDINGYFLCDRGRFGYEFVNAPDRIKTASVKGQPADRDQVLTEVSRILSSSRTIGIGSPRASLQSNYALRALVGKDNFYHGVSNNEHDLANLAIKILQEGPAPNASMKSVETADAVFILGEDLINTAPMLALAVRQSVRQLPLQDLSKINVPVWNDAAARELIQEDKGPLFIATVQETKLDEISTQTFHGSPDEIARLGFAVAQLIDSSLPLVADLSQDTKMLALRIATALSQAKRPVIISGASCETDHVMKAAANVAWALNKKNEQAGIALVLPECNSMGLAMMQGQRLESAFNAVRNGLVDSVVLLENDLYRHAKTAVVDNLLKTCKNVIVLDHTNTPTVQRASIVIPAGTFAESDGTLINNEGRAQRYFQVYEATDVIQESCRWLMHIGTKNGIGEISGWKNFEGVTAAIVQEEPSLKGIEQITPPSNFRVNGQRIPRETHRFSGRTAMLANVNVSEPKPPMDADSPLSYTMEGYRGQPPSSMIPFFWSPGWNSVQSINKYQQEVGGPLRGGDPGIKLFNGTGKTPSYFTSVPEKFIALDGHLLMLHVHHIFGSEELSTRSESVAERVVKPYVSINREDAKGLNLRENDLFSFAVDGQPYQLPVKISQTIQKGMGGLPYGLRGLPFVDLPAWGIIKKG